MPQRLTPLEVSLLALDTARTPGHVGTVDIFDPGPEGFDYERLLALIADRISFVPRYRQRIRGVPARLAGPAWVDDENFDLTFHIRRSALPRPGTMDQLREFVGRVLARRLDRSRPLWEMYLVEGLENDRFALIGKSHLSLVDGIDTVDLGQVLLDAVEHTHAVPSGSADPTWHPLPEPTPLEMVGDAFLESAQDPAVAVENLRGLLTGALGVAIAVGETVGGVGGALGELAGDALRGRRPPVGSPLGGVVSEQRRFAVVTAPLADFKVVRQEHRHTINDVVLAVIAGGLRAWLLTRGESIRAGSSLAALVPMSVTEDDGEPTSLGSQVAPHLQSLPIGEPNALMRLHQVAYETQAHKDTGRAVDARSLSDIAGFAPTTLHALGVRVAVEVMRRPHDLVITNVPGPQLPLYAAGARLEASYPVLPLAAGHQLAIGVTSYDGEMFFGLTGDRDAITDLDVLAQCLGDALEELLDTTMRAPARQPTRKASPAARKAAAKKAAAKQDAARARKTPAKRPRTAPPLSPAPKPPEHKTSPELVEGQPAKREPPRQRTSPEVVEGQADGRRQVQPANNRPRKKAEPKKAPESE